MKTCSFCAEEIQDAAIKCRYCGSMLNERPPVGASSDPNPPRDLFVGSPSWKAQLLAHGGALGLLLAGASLAFVLPRSFGQSREVGLGVGGVLVVAAAVWSFRLWLARRLQFRITTAGIDVESGLIGRRVETVQLWKIRDISYQQTVMDRLFKLARIHVVTQDVSSPDVQLWGLPDSRQVFEQLKRAVEAARRKGGVIGIVE